MVRQVAGKLGYLRTCISPIAAFAASYLQQCLQTMTVAGMKTANGIIREIQRLEPVITYLRPTEEEVRMARVASFSDGGFPHKGSRRKVAQEGCIVGIAFGTAVESKFQVLVFTIDGRGRNYCRRHGSRIRAADQRGIHATFRD